MARGDCSRAVRAKAENRTEALGIRAARAMPAEAEM
jgi:hypothetical protein